MVLIFLILALGCVSGQGKSGLGAVNNQSARISDVNASNNSKAMESAGNSSTDDRTNKPELLVEEVIPERGILINATWGDVGPKTISSGALNLSKFEALLSRNGRPITDTQLAMLVDGSNDSIRIDTNDSYFILDFFWAFGLVNKNHILDNYSRTIGSSTKESLASTAGWPLGDKSGSELYSSKTLVQLDQRQQNLVEKIASNVYRPCCNNPTSAPDCNHGMAALGLAEWMAYQNASEDDIYRALLAANSYWFPQAYVETAAYLGYQNRSWSSVEPKEILSANYSSYGGYINTQNALKSLPSIYVPGAGSCGA